MTTSASSVFVDTNVLVYAQLNGSPFQSQAQAGLQQLHGSNSMMWVSRQVLREYLAAMTRSVALTGSIALSSLVADIHYFSTQYQIAEDNSAVTAALLQLLSGILTGGKQVYDANIVATMQTYGITHLLTHNTADFARFASIVQIIPLVS
jgi:predicted nucleic acid-binding protein